MKISKLYNKIVEKFGVSAFVSEDKSHIVTENTKDVKKYLDKKNIKYTEHTSDTQWIIINSTNN